MVVMATSRECWGSEPKPWVGPRKQAKGEVQPRVLHLGGWEPVLMCTPVPTLRSHPPCSRPSSSDGPQTGDPMCASFASSFVPTLGLLSQLLLAPPSPRPLTSTCHGLEAGAEWLCTKAGLVLASDTQFLHGQKVLWRPVSSSPKLYTWECPGVQRRDSRG